MPRPSITALRPTQCVMLVIVLMGVASVAHAADAPITLENDRASLVLDPVFGRINQIVDKASRIELTSPPELAANFHLVLLTPDKKMPVVVGRDQRLSAVERKPDGLVLRWNGPLKDTAGASHKIDVRMDVTLIDNTLTFRLHADNRSNAKIREACYPAVGGINQFGSPGKPADGVLWVPSSEPATKKITVPLQSVCFGYPGQLNMSFTCVQSAAAKKALYFASHDNIGRYKVYHFQDRASDAAKDVCAFVQHLPFTPPGKTFDGSPVVLKIVDGDWHGAGQVYRAWFDRAFGIRKPADDWIRRQTFFQMTMFQLPEGTVNWRFKDIPRWAKDAKDHGINAVQISGWHLGGHDNGYPYYTIDPRLGTWQELEDGIRVCHAMGLKVFFFVNYQQVMLESDWYKRELVKYREHAADGGLTMNIGWGMGTLWARMGHPKLMTWADPAFPEYRKIIVEQFAKLAEIGADGVHVDKIFPTVIDYNPNLPMSPDTAPWEGAILLTKEILAACRKHNPDWAMSFECNWDRMLQFGGATWWVGNQRITRSVFPENVETLAISMAYDYLGVNDAVREGHAVMLAPQGFCQSIGWTPFGGLAKYIKEVKSIQDSLLDTVFLGQPLGQQGAKLFGELAPGVACNVFRNLKTGKHVCILTNAKMSDKTQTIEGFEGKPGGEVRVRAPFRKTQFMTLPAEIYIPAETIVFVEEFDAHDPQAVAGNNRTATAIDPTPSVWKRQVSQKPLKVENDQCLVEVDRENGAITRIRDKKGCLELIEEPRLADSFRFTLPIPGKESWQTIEANYIRGRQQMLSSFDVKDKKLTLHWDKPLVNYLGERYDVSATMTIELVEDGAKFNLKIDNATPYQIGEVFFPMIGGMQGLGSSTAQRKATQFVRPTGPDAVATLPIFREFINGPAFGDQGPEQSYDCTKGLERWIEFFAPKANRSVYIGACAKTDRSTAVRLELEPSGASMREDGNWPRPEELRGLPVGVNACFVDFANMPAKKTYEAPTVLITFHDGDWHAARTIYKKSQ